MLIYKIHLFLYVIVDFKMFLPGEVFLTESDFNCLFWRELKLFIIKKLNIVFIKWPNSIIKFQRWFAHATFYVPWFKLRTFLQRWFAHATFCVPWFKLRTFLQRWFAHATFYVPWFKLLHGIILSFSAVTFYLPIYSSLSMCGGYNFSYTLLVNHSYALVFF